ncbi:MAG: hypothetical protein EBU90_19600 [Proteobacteria bacterium]|nr:hypothetical protein [Pseudomonadota bacterium]NBP16259.1 hypothetical protein [bacterium]
MAGNARFHNKWHRRGHHSSPSVNYPDSATDPIASKEEPFIGDFYLAGSLSASGNATIMGSLSVLGDLSYIDTIVSVTSALSVINMGTGPAFTVVQYGPQPIARFIDGDATGGARAALFIENNGQIVINGTNPSLNRTVSLYGTISGSHNCEFQSGSAAEGQQAAAFNQSVAHGYQSFAVNQSTVRGRYGFGTGINTTATGSAASVFGQNTTASADGSHAQGIKTVASGRGSHAEGILSEARQIAGHAEGSGTIAQGDYSHAEGFFSRALSAYSHSEGFQTVASGDGAHSEGNQTEALGDASHAEGTGTDAIGTASHAEGAFTISRGAASHAEGYITDSSGNYSHTEGSNTIASGAGSHAEGYTTSSPGSASHAEGQTSVALGTASHAEGHGTFASGNWSHAQGYLTSAFGLASYAAGIRNLASGSGSTALGTLANAVHPNSFVFSSNSNKYFSSSFNDHTFNVFSSGGNFLYNNTTIGDPASAVAFIVLSSGQVGIGVALPDIKLTVAGAISSNATLSATGFGVNYLQGSLGIGVYPNEKLMVAGNIYTSGVLSATGPGINYFDSNVGIGSRFPTEKLTVNGNVSCFGFLSATSVNYHLYTNNGGLSTVSIDPRFNLIQGRVGINTAPLSTYALHIRGGNIRVDGVDYSTVPDISSFDTDGQSLFDLRSGSRNTNYSLSIAESGVRHFMKFFGGRQGDANPFIAVNRGDSLRFASVSGFYFEGGFIEMGRFDRDGNFGIGSFNGLNGAENNNLPLPAKLTVTGGISSNGGLSATGNLNYFLNNVGVGTSWPVERLTVVGNISTNRTVLANALSTRNIDIVHEPANDGFNPILRIGEISDATNTKGFSGALLSYNEGTNVFGISSFFNPIGYDAININRFGDVGLGQQPVLSNRLTINGGLSSSGGLSAAYVDLLAANVITPATVTDSGSFLIIKINGNNKAIRIWDYTV